MSKMRRLTNFNVAISIVSLFFLLAKLIAFIMKVYYPVLAIFVNTALAALYTVSVYGQIGPDYADSRYPAPAAWYFRKGCDLAKPYGKYKSCQIAQASLGVTLLMLYANSVVRRHHERAETRLTLVTSVVYLVNLGVAVHAMWPNEENTVEDDEDGDLTASEYKRRGAWEMQSWKSPAAVHESPFTPRTQAFHTLDRQLPLRRQQDAHHYA